MAFAFHCKIRERHLALRVNEVAIPVMSSSYSLGPEWVVDPAYGIDGFETAAGFSTIGQRSKDRGNHCKGKGNTCKAYKAKGQEYCVGHLRSMGLLDPKAD